MATTTHQQSYSSYNAPRSSHHASSTHPNPSRPNFSPGYSGHNNSNDAAHISHPSSTHPNSSRPNFSPGYSGYNNENDTWKNTSSNSNNLPDIIRPALGLHPAAPLGEEELGERKALLWTRLRATFREPFVEFFGVVVMVMFGTGSVAQVLLSTGLETAPGGNGYGNYQSINWGWALGVMLGIYVAGDSGAYLNPALTFSNCLYRQLPWRRFPIYFLAQLLGGFVGSGIVYANYISAIDWFEGGPGIRTVPPAKKATAAIFCTYPQEFLPKSSQFFSEFIASALLVFVVFALKDPYNNGVPKDDKWFPLALFFLVFGIGSCFGWETSYAINIARDFGPRLMSYAVGYPFEVWSAGGYFFWIPMVAPFLGCAFGGFLYDVFIYTGPSPVNTPWLGFKYLWLPYAIRRGKENLRREKEEGIV